MACFLKSLLQTEREVGRFFSPKIFLVTIKCKIPMVRICWQNLFVARQIYKLLEKKHLACCKQSVKFLKFKREEQTKPLTGKYWMEGLKLEYVSSLCLCLYLYLSIIGASSIVDYFWFDFAHRVANLSPLQSRCILLIPVLGWSVRLMTHS